MRLPFRHTGNHCFTEEIQQIGATRLTLCYRLCYCYGMKAKATGSSIKNSVSESHEATFAKVFDGRKQPIRGLWVRNGRYYAQLKIENQITGEKKTRRVPLVRDGAAVETQAQAVAELNRLRTQRTDNNLPVLKRTDKFTDYAKDYLESIATGTTAKRASTIAKETAILARWCEPKHLGNLRLSQIKRVHINQFIASRRKEEASPRTINLDVIALRGVLKLALQDELINRMPTEGLKPLKSIPAKRPGFTAAAIEKLCNAAFERKEGGSPVTENAQQFSDYIKLMAYSGTRRNEALGLRWPDVDLEDGMLYVRRQVTPTGFFEKTKSGKERYVNLNPKLKAHLLEMQTRRAPDTEWVFPSPQRGDKDIPAKSFRESLELARDKAEMKDFGFHDCRHFFCSMCVMAGIDFMTIAKWVGHQDGGILIGKVYGHLADDHEKAQAELVNFGPVVMQKAVNQ